MTEDQGAALTRQAMEALTAGDAAPVLAAFARAEGPPGALMTALLASDLDAEVAAAFARVWQGIGAALAQGRAGLLRWYLAAEAGSERPARRALHRSVLARVLALDPPPGDEAGTDLCLAAARVALEKGGAPGLRGAACRMLQRLPGPLACQAANVFTAIHAVDLRALRGLLDQWPEGEIAPDLRRALNWATGLVLEFAGIDPWMAAAMGRQYRRDPQDPIAAQRWVQRGQHKGQGFATLAPTLQQIRQDPADPNLKSVLQFGLWQARNIGDDGLAESFSDGLRRLDPAWTETARPALPHAPTAFAPPAPGADLAQLAQAAQALAGSDLRLDGAWDADSLRESFEALAQAAANAPPGPTPGLAPILADAQRLLQLDRREFSWITHFQAAPHAMGQPRFGLVDLRLIPAVHEGLMAVIAAFCRAGVDWFLTHDPPGGLGPLARLVALHGKASLEIDRAEDAQALIDRLAAQGLIPEVLAIERDNLALNRGDLATPAPSSRQGSTLHPFLPRPDWSEAEGIAWQTLASDAPVQGRFQVLWPDGRLEEAAHDTPPGQIAQAHLPGLALVAEDFLIGPRGHALRPDPYHTSAEFPWPSAVMVAAGRRALRLRPISVAKTSEPVLVLEAFEALRWRNYYHWMVPILTRIALALDMGLLNNRRLVVPEGLSAWMQETLHLLGLTPDRLLVVPLGQKLTFADAHLLSSVEHVSPACVAALRRRLLAGVAGDGGQALFLSRRGQKARRMENEEAIEDMAAEMGFQVVAPQDLGIAGQISAFAGARGVAAVEGAALTNTLFSPPGMRVLAMCCENDMMPIFNDLSIVLGHHHRKLAGQGLPVGDKGNRFQPPFAVNPDLARASLQWVLDGSLKDART